MTRTCIGGKWFLLYKLIYYAKDMQPADGGYAMSIFDYPNFYYFFYGNFRVLKGLNLPSSTYQVSSAYWRGDKNRESLQRVYGERLKEYLKQLEEAKKYDHRLLGVKQELFFSHHLRNGLGIAVLSV